MKGIEILKSKRGDRFRAEVRVNGRRLRRTFALEKDAITWKTTIQNEREKNRIYGISLNNGLYFEDVCNLFLESKAEIRKSSEKTYKSAILTHLALPLGKKKIKDISLASLDSIKSRMVKNKHSPGGVNKIITLLKAIMKFAVSREFIDKNPFDNYRKLKVDSQKYEYWQRHEMEQFLELTKNHHYWLVFFFALNTGMRRGEICGLLWENFIWGEDKTARITFSEQLTPEGERQGLKGHTTRTLPLNSTVSAVLWSIKKEAGYVFADENGDPVNPNTLSRVWKEAQRQVGMKKKIKFHGARHSYASYLSSMGESTQTIGKLLGHKDPKVTQVYEHLSEGDLDRAAQTVSLGARENISINGIGKSKEESCLDS